MKRISLLLLSCVLLTGSCKKDDNKNGPATGKVRVNFDNSFGDQPIEMGPLKFTNANGDLHSYDLLKYYVSHFTLIRDDSSEVVSPGHELIDQADPASRTFTLDSIPNGRYVGVRFYFGVDYDHNHSGDQSGDLDPIHGMIWTWSTGYIFFKHEGRFIAADGSSHALVYHLGTDAALTSVAATVPAFEVSGNTRSISFNFDLHRLYSAPALLDFNTDDVRMSSDRDDQFWIATMKRNIPGAFQVRAVE